MSNPQTHDAAGREWLRHDELVAGLFVSTNLGPDSDCCIQPFYQLCESQDGFWFPCTVGRHFISGRRNAAGTHFIGYYRHDPKVS